MPSLASSNEAPLKVVKASAGSGKTHRLTGEYLQLLFSFAKKDVYKHILAVTFTNKATDEMKSRIVDELAHLAKGNKSSYLKQLMEQRQASETSIRSDAKHILKNILHDYSSFSISTIDRFFQQTMRAFTREIGLGGGYNVELDNNKVLDEAIDAMFTDLDKPENNKLLEWLIRYSEENMEDGKGWNVRFNIRKLAKQIFQENYKTLVSESNKPEIDKDLLSEYQKDLQTIIATFENFSKQLGEKGVDILQRHDLAPEDFKGKNSSPLKHFVLWANGTIKKPTATFEKFCDNIDAWSTKTTPTDIKSKMQEAYAELNRCIREAVQHYANMIEYNTATIIVRNFFTLGILSDIDYYVREYCTENNLMLLSDTTELLSKIIEGTDTPFVFEKVGSWIDHYMIDEFQDTSSLQWANFLPLLKDSLASGNKNLIVGDVKQSIYRWRNSDWKLLNEQLDKDFRHEGVSHDTLEVNWRSARNVVLFNNALFVAAAEILQDTYNSRFPEPLSDSRFEEFQHKITDVYTALEQSVSGKHQDNAGRVKVQFVESNEETDWSETVLEQLPKVIEDLQDRGYSLRDIAILVRKGNQGIQVANCLLEYKSLHPNSKYKYDIISDEALLVANSETVKAVIAMLRHLQNPLDVSLRAMAVYAYYKLNASLDIASVVSTYLHANTDFSEPEKEQIRLFSALPLYEMVEEIIVFFQQQQMLSENVYVQSLLDMVLEFTTNNSSDIEAFLRWWDDSGVKKTIFTPQNQDAIRITTIHKSKGLGFGVVLLPFCDWDLDSKTNEILWCQTTVAPFDKVSPVPVPYSSKLEDTIFGYEYFNERLLAFIDNLNLLYVAFTRAKNELIAFAPKAKKTENVNGIAPLLWNCLQTTSDTKSRLDLCASFDEENLTFEVGETYCPKQTEKTTAVKELPAETLTSIPFDNRLKLRMNNHLFFAKDGKREFGNLMHEIISCLETADELPLLLGSYVASGDITPSDSKEIERTFVSFLARKDVQDWYSGKYKVLNEVNILLPNGDFVRPDRVMIDSEKTIVIDYKFGEKEEKRYEKQVSNYIRQIRKIGYKEVSGYICYVTLEKVVAVYA